MPEKPKYLDRIDEFGHVTIIRLKGDIDQTIIPLIESRIQKNRKSGSTIEKNLIIDYAKVDDVDTATVAFHLVRLKEYEVKGFKIGFINISGKLNILLDMFKQNKAFKVYPSEQEALKELDT